MQLSENTKTLLFVILCLALLWLMTKDNEPVKNKGALTIDQDLQDIDEDELAELQRDFGDEESSDELPGNEDTVAEDDSNESDETQEVEEEIPRRRKRTVGVLPNRDYAPVGGQKRASYDKGKRSQKGGWESHFDNSNLIFKENNDGTFHPNDDSDGNYASFTSGKKSCGSSQNCPVEDLFNPENYLPKETNDQWFKTQKEPVSIKNRHLVNVVRPIGIDTIVTSQKNASRDIRGNPPCPKFVISPFLNSPIEPDNNIRVLA